MNFLTPTNVLIIACVIIVLGAIVSYRNLHKQAEASRRDRRAQINIMVLGRARLDEILDETVRKGKYVTLTDIAKEVEATMSITNFLELYPELTERPRMAYAVHSGIVQFTFMSPATDVLLQYRTVQSMYLLP